MSPSPVSADALVSRHARADQSLVAILHAIQDEAGYVPEGCVPLLAKTLNLSRAEVHGVLTYYHHFRTTPPARVTIQLCRAEACRSLGGEALVEHAQARTGCRIDQGAQGDVELESVYCLGFCAQSPSAMINGEPHARMTAARFDALLTAADLKEPA